MGGINQIERGINAPPERVLVSQKDRKFVDWLQKNMLSPVKKRQLEISEQKQKIQYKSKNWIRRLTIINPQKKLAENEKKFSESEKLVQYLSSDDFKKELAHWEPWRLNDKSVETGNNLYIKAAKGYASESFLNWTKEEAEEHSITQNQFLAGITESVRKTEWEAIKIMASKDIATEYILPHLIIGKSPVVDTILFKESLEEAGKKAQEKNIAGLFSKEEAKKIAGLGLLALFPYELQQTFAPLVGGPLTRGTSLEKTIGLYDEELRKLFDSEFNFWGKKEMISVIVEEELHHQKYKHSEISKEKDKWFKKNYDQADAVNKWDAGQELDAGQEIEKAVGIKQMVWEIAQEMPPLEKLLEPFYQRIGQKQK